MGDRRIVLQIKSHPDNVSMVGLAIRGCCSLYMNESMAKDMELAVVEAINNVIEHSYQGGIDHDIQVFLKLNSKEFCARIRDFGREWNLTGKGGLPEIGETAADIPEGGFGVFFIRQLMDEVELIPETPGSTLILKKSLDLTGRDYDETTSD